MTASIQDISHGNTIQAYCDQDIAVSSLEGNSVQIDDFASPIACRLEDCTAAFYKHTYKIFLLDSKSKVGFYRTELGYAW